MLGINLPYDPAIPQLGIHAGKTIIQKDTCTPVFIAALFTIARTQKQPKCPSTGEQIKKIYNGYIYIYIYIYSGSDSKESAYNAGDMDSISGLGRYSGEGGGYWNILA